MNITIKHYIEDYLLVLILYRFMKETDKPTKKDFLVEVRGLVMAYGSDPDSIFSQQEDFADETRITLATRLLEKWNLL